MATLEPTIPFEGSAPSGDTLRTTVIDFGGGSLRCVRHKDLAILYVTGLFSRPMAREIELLCGREGTNVGIDFSGVRRNPATGKLFDGSLIPMLKSVQSRMKRSQRSICLCAPPAELVDMLTLAGTLESFALIHGDPASTLSAAVAAASAQRQTNTAPLEERPPSGNAGATQKRIETLSTSLRRSDALERGMNFAAQRIKQFLPTVPPQLPGWDIAFYYKTSEKVGGDFFDFIPLAGGKELGLIVGDVSGHGIEAAILMAMVKKVLQLRFKVEPAPLPSEVLVAANEDIFPDMARNSFITVLAARLHLETGELRFAKAGQEPPIAFRSGGPCEVFSGAGMPVGIANGKRFGRLLKNESTRIAPGACLLLYTDGLPEAMNPAGAQYTRERLHFSLEQVDTERSCREVLESILAPIERHMAGKDQEDDFTAVLIRRLV